MGDPQSDSTGHRVVGRWQTQGNRFYIELHKDTLGFHCSMGDGAGNMGDVTPTIALARIHEKIDIASLVDGIRYFRVL